MDLIIHSDGGAIRGECAVIGFTIDEKTQFSKRRLYACSRHIGLRTSNEAEYIACIEAFKVAITFSPENIQFLADSKLLVEQLSENWRVKHPNMQNLFRIFQRLKHDHGFDGRISFKHIPRELNSEADALANIGYEQKPDPVFYGELLFC